MKKFLTAAVLFATFVQAGAQSKNFKLGQALEIQSTVLQEVADNYVDTVDFRRMIDKGINSMLGTLDPYTVYFPEEDEETVQMMTTGIYGGVGSLIRKLPGQPVKLVEPYEGSPAVKAGLEPGDEIVAIDGQSILDLTSEQASDRMKGQPATDVRFTVIKGRSGDTVDVTVTRERIHISNVVYAGMIRDSIGYIAIDGFTSNLNEEVRKEFEQLRNQGAKRLVIDLRDNGGGVMEEAIEIASIFVPKGTLVVSSKGRAHGNDMEYRTTLAPLDTVIPLLVMINSQSASASEIFAGAMQDLDRATVAGKRSYGKGLIQSIRPTPYNGKVKITTGKYYTPSGRCVQAIDYSHRNEDGSVGFVPDSLKKEFKTRSGRSVYDGGGITPDIEVESPQYSRTAIALVMGDITGDFAIEYYKKHPSIASAGEFRMSDADYEDFVKFAATQEFDVRSSAQTALDALIKVAESDNLYGSYKAEIDALSAKLNLDKESSLRARKAEILPLVEREIVEKYYFNRASTVVSLRNDPQLNSALDKW